ncbi:Uncharacterised protein [Rikenella microfusus]|uniref:Uncharacterized protein n=1 Tax=Rikenella microfusus TaxID=28139 RepID=A0A379MSK4_9BACT|nr:Uncharacterised protein [Rikenella microfusus]
MGTVNFMAGASEAKTSAAQLQAAVWGGSGLTANAEI